MKPISSAKKNSYQSDDDNVRYKLNSDYFNNAGRSPRGTRKQEHLNTDDDDGARYKFPTVLSKPKSVPKPKPKPKIKVNFWSTKASHRHDASANKDKASRRHTIAAASKDVSFTKPKNSEVKVRKRVSFLPSPLFSENHVPMVTVPDDLTIQLNEEEANDLGEDLNLAFVNSDIKSNHSPKRKTRGSQSSPRAKRKRSSDDSAAVIQGSVNELEFFSKYVVQKLRKMETNQRIYSENLINTVLMLGQLGKLNGKSKIAQP